MTTAWRKAFEEGKDEALRTALLAETRQAPRRLQELIDELAPRFIVDPARVVAAVWDLVGETPGLRYGLQGWICAEGVDRCSFADNGHTCGLPAIAHLTLWHPYTPETDDRQVS